MFKYVVLFCIPLLVSCRVGEEYSAPKFLAENDVKEALNLSDKSDNIAVNWYAIFKDDVLNTLLENILNSNLSIKQAEERLIQARYTLEIQSKNFLPTIDALGEYQYQKSNSTSLAVENINHFKIGFDSVWEMDIWGKGAYISEQYSALLDETKYSLLNVKTMMSAEAVRNYILLREAQEKLRIANKNLQLQKDILATVKNKHSAGVADDLALNQAEYVVETTKALIPSLKTTIETNKNALAVLLGVPLNKMPIDLDKCTKNIVADTFKYSVKNLYNLPLNIVHTRPDIMAAEKNIQMQNAVVNQAIANLYPNVNLEATFGYVSFSGSKLFNTNKQIYGYNPQLSQPIWHWKQLVNNIDLQKHAKEEYMLVYNEALLTALSELKNATVLVEQAYEANRYKKNSFIKMQNILQLTREKYHNGLVNFTDVADAENQLLSAQTDLVSSNAEILLSLTAFYKTTGGGYNLK